MKLIKEIKEQVELIDEVLISLKQNLILENSDFLIDEMSSDRYLRIKYTSSSHINFAITFMPFGIQVDIDRAIEVYDISMAYFNTNKDEFRKFIVTLFTSIIKVEYCGSNHTKIYFYNDNGDCVKTLKHVKGLYLKFGCKIKEYRPIYNK
jgi:hypothetical protein